MFYVSSHRDLRSLWTWFFGLSAVPFTYQPVGKSVCFPQSEVKGGHNGCSYFDAARRKMDELSVNLRWQSEMQPFFEPMAGRLDESMAPLEEVFHLD